MEITINLNMKLQPFDRANFENCINDILQKNSMGEVTGGGTLREKNGEIKNCDIDIMLEDKKYYNAFLNIISKLQLARGSKIISEKETLDIGNLEGLAIYLNGTDLKTEVYQNCDVNYVVEELAKAMKDIGKMFSYYEGPCETALYFYGESFVKMNDSIQEFIMNYPLCEKCRIVKIA